MTDDYSDLIARLRRIVKVSYGATIEEARDVSKTHREAIDTIARLCNDIAFERNLRASFAVELKEARIEIAVQTARIAAIESQLAAQKADWQAVAGEAYRVGVSDGEAEVMPPKLAARESAEPVRECLPEPMLGWTGHGEADNAIILLGRLDVSEDDDLRVEQIERAIRYLAKQANASACPPAAAASDRYSWTETGMKHDAEGSWVLASAGAAALKEPPCDAEK